ncbi:unnamed protein product, partial [Effrenium voratum]
ASYAQPAFLREKCSPASSFVSSVESMRSRVIRHELRHELRASASTPTLGSEKVSLADPDDPMLSLPLTPSTGPPSTARDDLVTREGIPFGRSTT